MKGIILLLAMLSSARAVVFYCDFKMYTWLVVGSQYTCEVYAIDHSNPTEVEYFHGQHMDGKDNSDVIAFSIYYVTPTLPKIPTGIENFFENLLVFRWTQSLTSLSAEDLQPFPELKVFFIRNADLFSIEGNVFQYNTKLNYIALDYNRIQHIGTGFLDGLTQLTSFYFHSNLCLNAYATNAEVVEIVRLKIIGKCPPYDPSTETTTVATTTVAPCDIRCPINDEVDALRENLNQANYKLDNLYEKFKNLEKKISKKNRDD